MANIQTVEGSAQNLNSHFEKARQLLKDNELKRKGIIRNLAYSIEQEGLLPCHFICEQIVSALEDVVYGVGPQYVRKCLDKKYKRKYQKRVLEENTPDFAIRKKNVPEDKPGFLTTGREMELALELYGTKIHNEILEEELTLLQQENVRLRQENQEIRADGDRLERRINELQLQLTQPYHIRVPTKIWKQLQFMALSDVRDVNMIVENCAYGRLESETDNV